MVLLSPACKEMDHEENQKQQKCSLEQRVTHTHTHTDDIFLCRVGIVGVQVLHHIGLIKIL